MNETATEFDAGLGFVRASDDATPRFMVPIFSNVRAYKNAQKKMSWCQI